MSVPTAAPAVTILPLQQQEQQIAWRLEDFTYFRKCGELTASPDLKVFGLNCQFCTGICLQFEVFLQHLREHHSQDIKDLYLKDTHQNKTKTEQATQTEEEEATAALVDSSMDTSNSNWNEITLINDKGEGESGGMEMQPTEMGPCEEVGQVYIMENATMQCELLAEVEEGVDSAEEETIIDPYTIFNANKNDKNINGSRRRRVGGAAGGVVSNSQEGLQQLESEKKKKSTTTTMTTTTTSTKGLKNHAEQHNEWYEKPRTRMQTNAIAAKSTSKEADIKTPSVREVEHNKEIVSYLLDAYKNNAKLWNPKDPHYKYNANRKVFDELSAPLERDMNCALGGTEIFTIIKGLRSRYRRELTKAKAQRRGKFKSRLWYFDKMAFLRNIIENKRAERAAKDRLDDSSDESENSANSSHEQASVNDSAISLQNKAVLSFLLATFKRHERLWDPDHPDYKNSNKNEHYDKIAEQLRESMNVSITGEQCFAEINKLRMRYRNELRTLNQRKGLHVPKLWCFDQMEFLGKILEERLRRRKACIATQPRAPYFKAKPIVFTSETEELQFIGIYRNYSALWDVDHPDYRSARYRNMALSQMLEEVNSTFELNASFEELQKTLYLLRKAFSEQKQQILRRNEDTTSSPPTTTTTTSSIYAALAEFLEINLGPFRCEFCAEIIKTSDQYKIHLSGHDGTPPFICTLCGKGFQIPSNLSIHIRRHKGDFPHGCDECEKCFATSTEAANHKRTHTGERPFICDLCGKSFKTWSFFDVHRRSTHLADASQFHCPICEKDFYERNRYTDHMNRHLNIRKHLCSECGKSYTTFANLQKHMELHAAVKKYKCTVCNMRFAQYPSLRWHKRKAHAQQMEQ